MELVFYVYGIQAIVTADPDVLLKDAVQIALKKTNNTEIPVEMYFCMCDHKFLDLNSALKNLYIKNGYGEPIFIDKQALYVQPLSRKRLQISQINPY